MVFRKDGHKHAVQSAGLPAPVGRGGTRAWSEQTGQREGREEANQAWEWGKIDRIGSRLILSPLPGLISQHEAAQTSASDFVGVRLSSPFVAVVVSPRARGQMEQKPPVASFPALGTASFQDPTQGMLK